MTVIATGADGRVFAIGSAAHPGYFGSARANGDPSDLPLDGIPDVLRGAASGTAAAPMAQRIRLRLNDPATCRAVYAGGPSTGVVHPRGRLTPICDGAPACQYATVAEAISTAPAKTTPHVEPTISVVNEPSTSHDMEFLPLAIALNAGAGLHDAFTWFLPLDAAGAPGANARYPDVQGSGRDLRMSSAMPAPGGLPPRLAMNVSATALALHPGDTRAITVGPTTTRGPVAHGGPEHGLSCRNRGVTGHGFGPDDALIHTYRTADADRVVS